MQHNTNTLHSIRDIFRWGVSQMNEHAVFFGHGTENAEDEMMLLLSESLHLAYPIKTHFLNAHLTEQEKTKILSLLQRRIEDRIPMPYLLGRAWFMGFEFIVDERVLIPRSPIAELIQNQFEPWINSERVLRIADMCTGSACLAIACAYAFPQALVDAIELDEGALAVAALNIKKHDLEDSVKLIQSNLWQAVPKEGELYDVIISNPPYVSQAEWDSLPKEYHHEPQKALISVKNSPDGLELVEQLCLDALPILASDGILIVEVGNSEEALVNKYPSVPFTWLEFAHGGSGVFLLTAEQLVFFAQLLDDSQHKRYNGKVNFA